MFSTVLALKIISRSNYFAQNSNVLFIAFTKIYKCSMTALKPVMRFQWFSHRSVILYIVKAQCSS